MNKKEEVRKLVTEMAEIVRAMDKTLYAIDIFEDVTDTGINDLEGFCDAYPFIDDFKETICKVDEWIATIEVKNGLYE